MKAPVRVTLLAISAGVTLLRAQGTTPREDASKYSAQARLGSLSIGADLWGHYIPVQDGASIKADGYLAVEVALFASSPETRVSINAGQFALNVNGQRLSPVSPGLVTVGYVVPGARQRGPRVEADGGVGPVIVAAGRDPVQQKFPGDSGPGDVPLPSPPQGRDEGLQAPPIDPVKAVAEAALPEGSHPTPISGYLFYAFPGKLKRIKHASLEYTTPAGTAALSLK